MRLTFGKGTQSDFASAEAPTLSKRVVHFAPDRRRLFYILLIAFFITAFVYENLIRATYSDIAMAVDKANVIEDTLRTIPNYPIGPRGATGPEALNGTKLDQVTAFEVLKAWGVLGKNVHLSQLMKGDKSLAEEALVL